MLLGHYSITVEYSFETVDELPFWLGLPKRVPSWLGASKRFVQRLNKTSGIQPL